MDKIKNRHSITNEEIEKRLNKKSNIALLFCILTFPVAFRLAEFIASLDLFEYSLWMKIFNFSIIIAAVIATILALLTVIFSIKGMKYKSNGLFYIIKIIVGIFLTFSFAMSIVILIYQYVRLLGRLSDILI